MKYPNTPKTLISQIYSPDKGYSMNIAWRQFFDLYHTAIRASVYKSFAQYSWRNVNELVIEDVISNVLYSLIRLNQPYDRQKNFRGFLKTVIHARVNDYIRSQNAKKISQGVSIETPVNTEGTQNIGGGLHDK
jgi:DNA-directed RNA polymerase specialized sigma24 family protein